MKILVGLAASTLLVASPALAQGYPNPHNPNIQPGGNGHGNNGCGNGNGGNDGHCHGTDTPSTPGNPGGNGGNGGDGGTGGAGGNGGSGGAGGNGTGVGIGVGIAGAESSSHSTSVAGALASVGNTTAVGTGGSVGDTTATGGTALGINENDNRSSATGGNATGGAATGGSVGNTTATGGAGGSANAAGGAGGNSGGNTLQNITNYKRAFRTAPMAYAPSMIAGECQRSVSFGISTPVGGFSHGKTKANKFCELVKLRSVAADMSLSGQFQCAILAQDKRWARAMKAVGETCVVAVPVQPVVIQPVEPAFNGGERG